MSEAVALSTESPVKPLALDIARRFYVGLSYPALGNKTIYPIYGSAGEFVAACYELDRADHICSMLNDSYGVGRYQNGERKSRSVIDLQQQVEDMEFELEQKEDDLSNLQSDMDNMERRKDDEIFGLDQKIRRLEDEVYLLRSKGGSN